jgi:hypothetical protein
MDTSDISDRSRGLALVLAGPLGWCGGHRFYAGKPVTGVLMLLTAGGLGLWWLYDVIILAAGAFRDDEGKRLVRWWETSPPPGLNSQMAQQLDLVLEELDVLRVEMGDLGERVDFMERVVTRAKERNALPPPE